MDQMTVGRFIAQKRKEKNLTQQQLAEKIGVSNKSVSKWECGKCMPDYGVVQALCRELDVSVAELMNGETDGECSIHAYDERQTLEMMKRIQELENQRVLITGLLLIVMGIALFALSHTVGGSAFRDFVSGVMLGLSVGGTLAGIFVVARSLAK